MSSPRLLIIDEDHAFLETLPELVRLRLFYSGHRRDVYFGDRRP